MEQEYNTPEDSVADYEDALLIGKSTQWKLGYLQGKEDGLREARAIVNKYLV